VAGRTRQQIADHLRANGAMESLESIQKRLRELGAVIDVPAVERVYDALVEVWTGRKGNPPSLTEIGKRARITQGSTDHFCRRLREAGRAVFHPEYGWIPVVPKRTTPPKGGGK